MGLCLDKYIVAVSLFNWTTAPACRSQVSGNGFDFIITRES